MTRSESEGKKPKPTPLPHMRLWFDIAYFLLEIQGIQNSVIKQFKKFYKQKNVLLLKRSFLNTTLYPMLEIAPFSAFSAIFFHAI